MKAVSMLVIHNPNDVPLWVKTICVQKASDFCRTYVSWEDFVKGRVLGYDNWYEAVKEVLIEHGYSFLPEK